MIRKAAAVTDAVSSRRTPGGNSALSMAVPTSASGMKETGTKYTRPTIERMKKARPDSTVFQRCSVHQRSVRWYQAMTGPSVYAAIRSDLSV